MPKRNRESAVQFMIQTDYVLIKWHEKFYAWIPPQGIDVSSFVNVQDLEFNVLHDSNHKPMLDVENVRMDKSVFREEITPLYG